MVVEFFNASEDAQMVCLPNGIAHHINPMAAAASSSIADDEGVFSIFDLLTAPANRKLARLLKKENATADRLHSSSPAAVTFRMR